VLGGTWTTTGKVSDPGGIATLKAASVDYGDGTPAETITIAADGTFALSHPYTVGGHFIVTVTVSDKFGGSDSDTQSVAVRQPPELVAVGDQHIDEGKTFQVTVSATDPDTKPADLRYSLLQAPPGATIDAIKGVITWTPGAGQLPGDYHFKVQVADDSSPALTDTDVFTVTIINVAPSVTLDPAPVSQIATGGTWTTTGKVSDPGGVGELTAKADYGDGTKPQSITLAADGTFSLSHVYSVHGDFTLTVTVTDLSGASDDDTQSV